MPSPSTKSSHIFHCSRLQILGLLPHYHAQEVEGGQNCSWVHGNFKVLVFLEKADQSALKKVKDTVLDDVWWERVYLTIKIIEPLISLSRFADMDQPILTNVYGGWDSMIESMRTIVMENECLEYETSA